MKAGIIQVQLKHRFESLADKSKIERYVEDNTKELVGHKLGCCSVLAFRCTGLEESPHLDTGQSRHE